MNTWVLIGQEKQFSYKLEQSQTFIKFHITKGKMIATNMAKDIIAQPHFFNTLYRQTITISTVVVF